MVKAIIFDAGPIISLAINNLLFLLEHLKNKFDGEFLISQKVKEELIDRPLATKKFQFEALRVLELIDKGIIKVVESKRITEKTKELMDLANNCFMAKGNYINIVHQGEIESIALFLEYGAKSFVVDERTTRYLIENPKLIVRRLERKLGTKVKINKECMSKLHEEVRKINVIRSVELALISYELGLLNKYKPKKFPGAEKMLLQSVLWALKLNGCSVSQKEIDMVVNLELKINKKKIKAKKTVQKKVPDTPKKRF